MILNFHLTAIVGPDGTLDLHVPNLPPGERVTVTIEVPDVPAGATEEAQATEEPRQYTARELLNMPAEERDRIMERAAAEAAEVYATDPELAGFEAFGEDDLFDEYPEDEE